MSSDAVIDWLMTGDPVIRWQVMRDLLPRPTPSLKGRETQPDWQAERARTVDSGWGAQFLSHRLPDGSWPKGRWTDTLWTLLVVMDCGLPPSEPRLRESAQAFIERSVTRQKPWDTRWMLTRMDLCHLGFWLRIGGYFGIDEPRLVDIAEVVLDQQMDDGGWNCRRRGYPSTRHGSFHTTFNVLEGLREYVGSREWGVGSRGSEGTGTHPASFLGTPPETGGGRVSETSPQPSPWKGEGAGNLAVRFSEAEARAAEFMLCHRMYRSDKTGEVIDEKFTYLTFPSHWHYTVLRGLDYLRSTPAIVDSRLDDPIAMLMGRRGVNGRWPVEKRIAGVELFDMEKMGGESRWNTLRMLRVMRSRKERIVNVE